ncbi:hypothetical protein Y032_0528g2983 [Ancylostoma ceylanicum]|uniref:Uncharacterized protein n=1 Tax=Ancylostoma ceylanicum TaxID=53326 RepID=A0A016WTI8_9BILA|nr:hypothetical protein Y032_0528g2983 [Ancylostoma ceylanicum]
MEWQRSRSCRRSHERNSQKRLRKSQEEDLTTDNRVPLNDDEYMEWLVKHNSAPEEETSDKDSHKSEEDEEEPVSVPPK